MSKTISKLCLLFVPVTDLVWQVKEFIHFGLTSQDVNNTCYPLMIMRFWRNIYMPKVAEVLDLHVL